MATKNSSSYSKDQYFLSFRILMILFRKYFNGTRLSSHKRKINFLIESNALNNN